MNRRDRDISSVGDALKKMLDQYSLHNKFDRTDLISSWAKIAGAPIAKRTERIFIKDDILFVELSSASLKHELNMSKSKLMEKIEEELGRSVVKNILFL